MSPSKPKAAPIQATWTNIGPGVAAEMLASNTGNRTVREAMVSKYARDMEEGRWRATGDGIRISTTGRILDGQHRLHAIVRSGVTVGMFVFTGVQDAAQDAIDTGAKRTVSDHLAMSRGVPQAPILAAVARMCLDIQMFGKATRQGTCSTGEIVQWIDENPDIHRAAEVARAVARQIDMAPATVGYCALVIGRVDSGARDQFFYGAASGEDLSAGDPRLTMRRRFADARRNRERLSRDQQISMILRAWNAWATGKTLSSLRVVSNGEDIKIPIPVRPTR